jgi:hypothetical protein
MVNLLVFQCVQMRIRTLNVAFLSQSWGAIMTLVFFQVTSSLNWVSIFPSATEENKRRAIILRYEMKLDE